MRVMGRSSLRTSPVNAERPRLLARVGAVAALSVVRLERDGVILGGKPGLHGLGLLA
jgi:hypothetical protein